MDLSIQKHTFAIEDNSIDDMKLQKFILYAFFVLLCLFAKAQERTLRLDYIFSGGNSPARISLREMSETGEWYGRTVNMTKVPVMGNGDIFIMDEKTGKTIYANSFSTLFQEWLTTLQSKTITKAFENTFLVPMPKQRAIARIRLYDTRKNIIAQLTHSIVPEDILISKPKKTDVKTHYVHKGGNPSKCIDVVILAEGYTKSQSHKFFKKAQQTADAILSSNAFVSYKDRFNFLAVMLESKDEGVSIPRKGVWKNTPLSSNYDTFYTERYLTTDHIFKMHDLLSGLAYEHIIILGNSPVYGGGGIYNSYTLTTADHEKFQPVVVHEFGHSFAALADEYDYSSTEDPFYFKDVEPWEQNITTQADFSSKWEDMIKQGVKGVGLVEGAGYQKKDVWRATNDCRMRSNKAEGFCPVCLRAIERMISFNLEEL